MISLKELNPKNFELTSEQQTNLNDYHRRINIFRKAYGKPMLVTSGVRDLVDHRRIYVEKARKPGEPIRVPMGSKHLTAQAADFADPDGSLVRWAKNNPRVLEEAGLYAEDGTVGWLHLQSVAPKSGKRWFLP